MRAKIRLIAKKIASHIVVFYILLIITMVCLQGSLTYPGTSDPLGDPKAWRTENFHVAELVTSDGLHLKFWESPPAPGMPSVLVFHGNGASAGTHAQLLQRFALQGFGIVMAEYRGYGGNPGSPSESGINRDSFAYLDWMNANWHVSKPVVMGLSIGTGAAVALAAARPTAGVILDAPFTSLPDVVWNQMYVWLPRFLYRSVFDNLALIKSVDVPVLILHGEADGVVPFKLGAELYAAVPCKWGSVFLPGVDHVVIAQRIDDRAGQGPAAVTAFLNEVKAGTLACKPQS